MNKREFTNVKNSDAYIARLVEVARAYYLEDQTQAEIARSLGLSRSLISRYLATARELGIVQITIAAPEWTFDALAHALRGRYPHLKAVDHRPDLQRRAGRPARDDRALRRQLPRRNRPAGHEAGARLRAHAARDGRCAAEAQPSPR